MLEVVAAFDGGARDAAAFASLASRAAGVDAGLAPAEDHPDSKSGGVAIGAVLLKIAAEKAIAPLMDAFRAFLARDRRTRIKVKVKDFEIEIESQNSGEGLREVERAIRRQLRHLT